VELAHFNQDNAKKYAEGKVDNEVEAWNIWSVLEPNAKMIREQNKFLITYGIMNEKGLTGDISKEELYARLGHVIGHEMSHGFDEYGVLYDKDGQNGNILTDEDMETLKEKLSKVESYYDGITVFEGYNCNGKVLSTEAIADMTGIEVILKLAEKEENFDYDKFFNAFAQQAGHISTYENDLYILQNDPHPLSYLRVNAVLQQQEQFQEFYDVQEGDGMYLAPEDRILIW
ncbi:MAG: hypothetical protein K6A23_16345, partial [Butyrivibrio sp.]|nr:hypothetical protein [Butyrivibrio sp.]